MSDVVTHPFFMLTLKIEIILRMNSMISAGNKIPDVRSFVYSNVLGCGTRGGGRRKCLTNGQYFSHDHELNIPFGWMSSSRARVNCSIRCCKTMKEFEKQLSRWSTSLPESVDVGGLLSRSAVAHKWKAPCRSIVIREALLWRMYDLGQQILLLSSNQHFLGARILLRSAIETLAILIYLNQKTQSVVDGELSFFELDEITMQLLMGSRNNATSKTAINILTILAKANKVHDGLVELHERLSESAHPNYDGVLYGFSSTNYEEFATTFENKWAANFGAEQEPATMFAFAVFEYEYNESWPKFWERLESWLKTNDEELESQRIAMKE